MKQFSLPKPIYTVLLPGTARYIIFLPAVKNNGNIIVIGYK